MSKRMASQQILLSIVVLMMLTSSATGQVVKQNAGGLDHLVAVSERLSARPVVELESNVAGLVEPNVRDAWARFRLDAPGEWTGYVDARQGRFEYAEGQGIPFLPGRGNKLTRQDIAAHLGTRKEVDLAVAESVTRAFLPRVAHLLGVDGKSLVLNHGRSGNPAGYLWLVDFDVMQGGLPIEGARVVFRINNGNLIQFGNENLPDPHQPAPEAKLTREQALAVLTNYIGGLQGTDTLLDAGTLHLLPVAVPDGRSAAGFAFGKGRGLAIAWQFLFQREGQLGTWRARVDAQTGELLEFIDANKYARVTGAVRVQGVSQILPMPYADLSTGGNANSAGIYSFTGTPTASTLQGPYVRIFDNCGSISESSGTGGDIAFGTSAGTDCSTPGHGGGGNTHSSRTQFYYLNRGKEIGRGWLPGNTWLNQQLVANVNISQTCNAYWNGTVNFFLSGGGCGNTGEIEGVSLHEFGHGVDSNDGSGFSADLGTGEAYADLIAALTTRKSCIGPGFYLSGNCGGYGDPCTACSGIRDIDWARRSSSTPHTVGNFTMNSCSGNSGYAGPCGREGHCESYVASEAVWDLAARDLPSPGSREAWNVVDRLWYLSNTTATAAFVCNTGSSPWTSHGCSTGSWWRSMRAVDDDDGNLVNGTPHSAALFAAFNRHGLACASDPGAAISFRACTQPTVPTLALSSGNNQVTLSWSGSTGVYDIYRNETGCNGSYIKIAKDVPGTSLVDNGVANNATYFYQVVAHPSGNEACASAPSACQSITVVPPPPVANFSFVCTGLSCSFDCTGSTGTGLTYAWNFGDSGTGTGCLVSHTYSALGSYTVTLTVTDSLVRQSSKSKKVSVTDEVPVAAEGFFTMPPCRLLDTRTTAPLNSNQHYVFNVAGNCGIPATAKAVSFNVTVISPTGPGLLMFFAGNQSYGGSPHSTINFTPAASPRANNAILRLATNGAGTVAVLPIVYVANGPAAVHLILDISGYFSEDTMPAPGAQGPLGFQSLMPCRLVDTRNTGSPLTTGTTRNFTVQGVCGIPPGATSAALNLTTITPTAWGWLTLWQAGTPVPPVSTLNFVTGTFALANGARPRLAATTPDVAVQYFAGTGDTAHVALDTTGYFKSDAPLKYRPITPCRLLDTRYADQGAPFLTAWETRTFQAQGNCGVPVGAKAAVLNVVAVDPVDQGYLILYPSGNPVPPSSMVNYHSSQGDTANGVIVPLSTQANDIAITNGYGSTQVIVDVFGYFQ